LNKKRKIFLEKKDVIDSKLLLDSFTAMLISIYLLKNNHDLSKEYKEKLVQNNKQYLVVFDLSLKPIMYTEYNNEELSKALEKTLFCGTAPANELIYIFKYLGLQDTLQFSINRISLRSKTDKNIYTRFYNITRCIKLIVDNEKIESGSILIDAVRKVNGLNRYKGFAAISPHVISFFKCNDRIYVFDANDIYMFGLYAI
jgi:hypothetical protein